MEYVVAKVRDKIRIYEKVGKVLCTSFLTPAEVLEVSPLLRGYEHSISGGFDEAERRIIIIGNFNNEISEFCAVVRLESRNGVLSHRSVLGSILGLGIKREMIGDIIVKNKSCDIIVMREMKEYILNNLNSVGKERVSISEGSFENLLSLDNEKISKSIIVASLRVDAIISAVFLVSREKSLNLVNLEKVLINFLPCNNASKSVKIGDLISVRGFGRVKILEVLGETKKGRIKIWVESTT